MRPVLLDTSVLLYWSLDPARLSARAAAAIRQAEPVLLSSISVWEVGIKHQKGRLTLPLPVRQWALELTRVAPVQFIPVDLEIWLANLELAWDHGDPADRTVVATALVHGCPLVTSDQRIRDFYAESIW